MGEVPLQVLPGDGARLDLRVTPLQVCGRGCRCQDFAFRKDFVASDETGCASAKPKFTRWFVRRNATPASRWSTTLSSKVNLPHAINFRAKCGANLVI